MSTTARPTRWIRFRTTRPLRAIVALSAGLAWVLILMTGCESWPHVNGGRPPKLIGSLAPYDTYAAQFGGPGFSSESLGPEDSILMSPASEEPAAPNVNIQEPIDLDPPADPQSIAPENASSDQANYRQTRPWINSSMADRSDVLGISHPSPETRGGEFNGMIRTI